MRQGDGVLAAVCSSPIFVSPPQNRNGLSRMCTKPIALWKQQYLLVRALREGPCHGGFIVRLSQPPPAHTELVEVPRATTACGIGVGMPLPLTRQAAPATLSQEERGTRCQVCGLRSAYCRDQRPHACESCLVCSSTNTATAFVDCHRTPLQSPPALPACLRGMHHGRNTYHGHQIRAQG
jgi:hypothetical protein